MQFFKAISLQKLLISADQSPLFCFAYFNIFNYVLYLFMNVFDLYCICCFLFKICKSIDQILPLEVKLISIKKAVFCRFVTN